MDFPARIINVNIFVLFFAPDRSTRLQDLIRVINIANFIVQFCLKLVHF